MSEKITVAYEIPAPPDGWVYDCVRKASEGEQYFNGFCWNKRDISLETNGIYPVAIRKQQWRPSLELVSVLRPGWIACDSDGGWWWYSKEPSRDSDGNWFCGAYSVRFSIMREEMLPPINEQTMSQAFQIVDPMEADE